MALRYHLAAVGVVLLHSLTGFIQQSETRLRCGIAALRCFRDPLGSFGGILRHALAIRIQQAQGVLRSRESLVSRLAHPTYFLCEVFGSSRAGAVAQSERILRCRISAIRASDQLLELLGRSALLLRENPTRCHHR